MNQNIRKLMDAVTLLREVSGCELEVKSLSHKIQSMYTSGKEGKKGIELIDCLDDEELATAIRLKDERIGFNPDLHPFLFSYLRRNRSKALYMSTIK